MTTYELYINGLLCDLDPDEAVTLRFQSPLFSELDSIQSNRSYNISLPLSPNNLQAIGQAQRVDVNTNVPYIRLSAALYMNGVPLFTKGYAVVTDISDTINVTLTWGNVDNFQPLFDNSLRDLGPQLEELDADHIDWNESSTILDANTQNEYPGVAFWGVNFGMGLDNPKYIHPSVQVSTILEAIEKQHGITIDGKERLSYSPNLGPIVPLVGKNGDNKYNFALYIGYLNLSKNTITGTVGLPNTTWAIADGSQVKDQSNIYDTKDDRMIIDISDQSNIRFVLSGNVGVRDGALKDNNPRFQIMAGKANYSFDEYDIIYDVEAKYEMDPIDVDLNVGNYDYIAIRVTKYEWLSNTSDVNLITGNLYVYGNFTSISIIFPSVFPVAANLPDMSQGDFILALMNMNGLFAYADKDNPDMIRLISIDDIMAKTESGDVVDWSAKVVLNDFNRVDMPDGSEFTIDNLAQSNILDYDNADDVKTDTHGVIEVKNENIDKETELVTLPFSASDNETTDGVSCALVPIYEQQDNGDVNYSEGSDRILSGRGGSINGVIKCIGVFDPWMKFGGSEGIVESKYSAYRRVVSRVRLITIRAKLSEVDLLNLDYTTPVYISQFGQLFAIYSAETGEDGVCDCQLLTLNYKKSYYIQLDGQDADYSTSISWPFTVLNIPLRTNGIVEVSEISDSFITAEISDDQSAISVYVQAHRGSSSRSGTVKLSILEDETTTRTITITQSGSIA